MGSVTRETTEWRVDESAKFLVAQFSTLLEQADKFLLTRRQVRKPRAVNEAVANGLYQFHRLPMAFGQFLRPCPRRRLPTHPTQRHPPAEVEGTMPKVEVSYRGLVVVGLAVLRSGHWFSCGRLSCW